MKDQEQYKFKDLIDHFEGNEEIQVKLIRVRLQGNAVRFREVSADSLSQLLDTSFIWHLTLEGHHYWSNLCSKLSHMEVTFD